MADLNSGFSSSNPLLNTNPLNSAATASPTVAATTPPTTSVTGGPIDAVSQIASGINKAPTPAVITSDAAKKNVVKQQADMANLEAGMTNQAAVKAATITPDKTAAELQADLNPVMTDFKTAPVAGYTQEAVGQAGDKIYVKPGGKLPEGYASITPLTPEQQATADRIQSLQDSLDAAQKAHDDYVKATTTGIFQLTPSQQAQIDATTAQFEQLKKAQEDYNKRYTAGTTVYEQRAGRSEYANKLAMGNIQESINVGIGKIAEIDAKMAETLSNMRSSFEDKNYQRANDAYKAMNDFIKQKSDTIKEIYDTTRQAASDLREANKAALEEQKTKIESVIDLVAANMTGDSDKDIAIIKEIAQAQGITDINSLISAVNSKASANEAEQLKSDFGTYQYLLSNGQLPAGTTWFEYKSMLKQVETGTDKAPETVKVGDQTLQWTGTEWKPISTGATTEVLKQQVDKLNTNIGLVDKILSGNYQAVVGMPGISSFIPGTPAQLTKNQIDELAGILKLDNRQQLKGQGQISDFEFKVLGEASSALGANNGKNLSNADFAKVMNEIRQGFVSARNYQLYKADQPIEYSDFIQGLNDIQLQQAEELKKQGLSDDEVMMKLIPSEWNYGTFKQGGSGTPTATIQKVSSIPNGQMGGQCGHFVNQITGLGLGDSYQSKLAQMDSSITSPQPGMVFVMPVQGSKYGHTGVILSIKDGQALVKDSNWNNDEKISTHYIPISQMTGFTYA